MICLPPKLTKLFREKLKDGTINPEKISKMSSEERRTFFTEFLGENNAKEVNALFESKLLLKSQQRGIITWAKRVAGMKPEIQRDILSRVNKMTEVLQPENERAFLEDLAAHKLGVTVTMEEAGKIAELAKVVAEKKEGIEYGRAKVAFANYINELKGSIKKKLTPQEVAVEIAGTAKSLKASLDNSAIFRQGWKTLWTNPQIWWKNALQSFGDIWNTIGGKKVMDEVNAEIISRPTYNLMKKAKLAVGSIEEAFPSQIPEKIPVLGRIYTASQNAFTGFVYRTRADVFDKYIDIAKKSDIDLTDKAELESIGKLVNSLTGRGSLGRAEPAAQIVNNVFFSPRFLKSQIDVLTAHQFQKGVTPFVRKQAAINLIKIIGGTAAVLTIANAINPDSVEEDPRSADFGKIRIGDTRFEVTGGMASLVTLAFRLIQSSTKSSTTGKVTELNTGKFGAPTGKDVLYNFFENKLSPAVSVMKDILEGETFKGEKPTLIEEVKNLLMPIPITNFMELKDNPNSANIILAMIADALGIGTNTYSKKKKKPQD